MEQWYFDLLERDAFTGLGTERATFEECMAMYFLETAVRNSDVEWTVDEYAFEPGRYEIGVKRPLFAQYTMRITHLPLLRENSGDRRYTGSTGNALAGRQPYNVLGERRDNE